MPNNVSVVMDDLMEYLFCELKSRNMPITEFRMQKLIFKIKMELGEKHELFPKLPFYWYLKGPYSDVVSRSFSDLTLNCISIKDSFLFKDDLFGINSFIISDFPEIEEISKKILSDKDFFYNHLDKEIYREYEPYPFMHIYKYEIYDIAKNSLPLEKLNSNDYVDKFFDCEGKLPHERYFGEFSTLFSRLTTNVDLINEAGNFNEYWNLLRPPIIALWETFASGVRVKFRDDYYGNCVNFWDDEFKLNLKYLTELVNKTECLIALKDYSKQEYSPDELKLLKLTRKYL